MPSENPPEFEIRRNKHFEAVDLLTGELVPLPKNVAIRCRTAWLIIRGNNIFAKARTRKAAFDIAEQALYEELGAKNNG